MVFKVIWTERKMHEYFKVEYGIGPRFQIGNKLGVETRVIEKMLQLLVLCVCVQTLDDVDKVKKYIGSFKGKFEVRVETLN